MDFNNLLTVIQGNLSLLGFDQHLDNDSKDSITDIQNAVKKAQGLTSQLLTFSKGGAPLKKIGMIDKVLEETVKFHLHGTEHTLHINVADYLWKSDFDSDQLSQVFSNLITNSKEAIDGIGTIDILISNYTHQDTKFFLNIKNVKKGALAGYANTYLHGHADISALN